MVEHELAKPDPRRWITEGDGLRASATVVRTQWIDLKAGFDASLAKGDRAARAHLRKMGDWPKLEGLPRASMLLLGYAAEMYLKAGLAKAYVGCRTASAGQDGMFDRDVRRFGHHYVETAAAIEFNASAQDNVHLRLLRKMVTDSARYPLMPDRNLPAINSNRFDDLNETTGTIWNRETFDALMQMVERIRAHAMKIDADCQATASVGRFISIDNDGYLSSRAGGHLSPRIVFRFSSRMVNAGLNTLDQLRERVTSEGGWIVQNLWDEAIILEDQVKKTILRRGNQHFAFP